MKTEIIKTSTFTLTKRGSKAVTFNRFTMSNGTLKFSIVEGSMVIPTDEPSMKRNYNALINDGYTIREEKEQKASAPKPQKKQTKRFIYCKESKQIWAKEYSRRLAEVLPTLKGLDYKAYNTKRAELVAKVKADMKVWESENADRVNEELQKRWAERNAQ